MTRVLVGLGVALAMWGCSPGESTELAAPAREAAPEFTLPLLKGGSVSLAGLRGKTVIIDFWATWCPPCEFQVPELNAFWKTHKDGGKVAVVGVSVDHEGPDVVGAWAEEKGVAYPILLGTEALAREYGAVGYPTLIVVRPDGSIQSRHVGLIELDELEKSLAEVEAEASGPSPQET
ncbi:MAG: TlpA family protein disulfide reductase [Proteobacteria bacterium]|nr:TlpA family protein disulfide reductase [Pseudomonadota bacterium]